MRCGAVLDERVALGRIVPELRGGWRFGEMASMAPLGPAYLGTIGWPVSNHVRAAGLNRRS